MSADPLLQRVIDQCRPDQPRPATHLMASASARVCMCTADPKPECHAFSRTKYRALLQSGGFWDAHKAACTALVVSWATNAWLSPEPGSQIGKRAVRFWEANHGEAGVHDALSVASSGSELSGDRSPSPGSLGHLLHQPDRSRASHFGARGCLDGLQYLPVVGGGCSVSKSGCPALPGSAAVPDDPPNDEMVGDHKYPNHQGPSI